LTFSLLAQKRYRKIARTEHPDKKPNDPKASQRFAKINTAYETLSNPEKRREYDQQKAGGFDGGQPGYGGGGGGGFGQAQPEVSVDVKFGKSEHVVVLQDEGNEGSLEAFQRTTAAGFWLVFFFDNESNICKRIADAFVEAALSFGGMIRVVAVQYNDEEMSATPLTKRFGVKKTGELFLFSTKQYADLKAPMKFRGDAGKFAEISNFAGNTIPYTGAIVRDHRSLTRILIKDEHIPKLLLLTDKWSVPLIYKLLAIEFAGVLSFGIVRGESVGDSFLKRYKPVKRGDRLPILLYFQDGEAKPEKYNGMISRTDIRSYLLRQVGDYKGALISDHNSLTRFLIRNDHRPKVMLVTNKPEVPLIWKALSTRFETRIDFATARVASSQSTTFIMRRYKLQSVPAVLYFKNGDSKPSLYEGALRMEPLTGYLNKQVVLASL